VIPIESGSDERDDEREELGELWSWGEGWERARIWVLIELMWKISWIDREARWVR
jgi:hypothetical protein